MKRTNLFRIGDMAEMFHLSVGSLRHYEKQGLLKPEYTDPETGYRYYSLRQMEVLTTIRFLRTLDMPLEEIRDFVTNRDTSKILTMLKEQKEAVLRKQEELKRIEKRISQQIETIESAVEAKTGVISIKEVSSQRVAWVRGKITPRYYFDLETSIRRLEKEQPNGMVWLGKVGLGIAQEKLTARQFKEYDRVFLLLDEEEKYLGETEIWPESKCVCMKFQGSHKDAAQHYGKMLDFIEENQMNISGFSREITLIDEGITQNPRDFVTEIQIPVQRT